MIIKIRRLVIKLIHRLIVKYLVRCGGAFHTQPYGDTGLYVVLMNKRLYHEYAKIE